MLPPCLTTIVPGFSPCFWLSLLALFPTGFPNNIIKN